MDPLKTAQEGEVKSAVDRAQLGDWVGLDEEGGRGGGDEEGSDDEEEDNVAGFAKDCGPNYDKADPSTAILSMAKAMNVRTNQHPHLVFIRSGDTWTQQAYVKADNAEASDQFGYSAVALSKPEAVKGFRNDKTWIRVTSSQLE